MIAVTLASLRAHVGRLCATGIAVVLSVAFTVTVLLLAATFTQTLSEALTAQMARADVQVAIDDEKAQGDVTPTVDAALATIRGLPSVAAAEAQRTAYVEFRHGGRRATGYAFGLLPESLRWQTLARGSWPTAAGEGVLDESNAGVLGVGVGDVLRVVVPSRLGSDARAVPVDLRVVGLTEPSGNGLSRSQPTALVTAETLHALGRSVTTGILVRAAAGVSPETLAQSVNDAVGSNPVFQVRTREAAVAHELERLSGSTSVLTNLLLVFAVIAFVVTGFVIGNTFRVLVAQRTRELALLRCVGATRGNAYRMILAEAGFVGIVCSFLGVALGFGAAVGLVALSNTAGSGLPLNPVTVPPAALVAGVLAGTAVTVLSALGPARKATAVRPVAAMHPVDAQQNPRRCVVTAVLGVVLGGGGAVGLMQAGGTGSMPLAAVSAVVCLIGVLFLGALFLPRAISLVGSACARLSAAAYLAAASTRRNRAHAAATGSAMLIGCLVLAVLTTGIASVRESVLASIDRERPVDLMVSTTDGREIAPDLVAQIGKVAGVVAATPVWTGTISLDAPGTNTRPLQATGMDPDAVRAIARAPIQVPQPGTVIVHPVDAPAGNGNGNGQITVRGVAGDVTLTVVVSEHVAEHTALLARDTLTALDAHSAAGTQYLRLADGIAPAEIQRVVTDILSLSNRLTANGGAQDRARLTQILDFLLMVFLALLAVTMVIAFVGISNTVALSVIERRRESALLRAVGLTRGELVRMICTEAALTAAVSATLGLVIGALFGWAGVTVLGTSMPKLHMSLHLPWGQLVAILLTASVAGIVAAMLPAILGARRRPIQDLAAT